MISVAALKLRQRGDDALAGTYVVCGTKSWNRRVFEEYLAEQPRGEWYYVSLPEELETVVSTHKPDMAFFLHWSWKVPVEVLGEVRCINFHMTDLPFGRGGSPLQNLIARGHRTTFITAFEMTSELDAGPILLKEPMDLCGTAEDIYVRSSEIAAELILRILDEQPAAVSQSGSSSTFERRDASDSAVPYPLDDLRQLYDHIRMLDAEGYPPAFILFEGLRLEFRRAALYEGRVEANVIITWEDGGPG